MTKTSGEVYDTAGCKMQRGMLYNSLAKSYVPIKILSGIN